MYFNTIYHHNEAGPGGSFIAYCIGKVERERERESGMNNLTSFINFRYLSNLKLVFWYIPQRYIHKIIKLEY
jgi:hypothetical protein